MSAIAAALEAALDAFDACHDEPARLARALEAWRICRAPRLSELVLRIAVNLPAGPLRTVSAADAVADPTLLGPALERIRRARRTPFCVREIRVLLAAPADPRCAAWALELLVDPPLVSPATAPFWEAVVALLEHARDTGAANLWPTMMRLREGPMARELMLEVWERLYRLSLKPSEALVLGAKARIERLVQAYRAPDAVRLAQALLADIHAAPDDRDLKAVFADLLLRQGDPRGEFISLQLRRGAGERSRRELDLLTAWWSRWAHPLGEMFDRSDLEFRDGFVYRVTFEQHFRVFSRLQVSEKALKRIFRAPVWATVRQIDVAAGYSTWDRLTPLLRPPHRERLREWTGNCTFEVFCDLALGAPCGVETIELGACAPPPVHALTPAQRRALSDAPGLPALRRLSIAWVGHTRDPERWFLRTPLARRLRVLQLPIDLADLPGLLRSLAFSRLETLIIGRSAGTFTLHRRDAAWQLVVELGPDLVDGALAALGELPAALICAVRVVGDDVEQASRVRAALAHLGPAAFAG